MTTELVPLARYPVRPSPKPGESLAGYCWRIHAVNGLSPLCDPEAIRLWMQHDPCRVDLTRVCRLIGHDLTNNMHVHESGFMRTATRHGLLGRRATRHRFCPMCMAEHGHHSFLWDLPHLSACPRHRCRLIDRCDACYRLLAWRRINENFACQCKRALRDTAKPATRAEWQFARAIAKAIDSPVEKSAFSCGTGPAASPYKTEHLYELVQWMSFGFRPSNRMPEVVAPWVLRAAAGNPEMLADAVRRLMNQGRHLLAAKSMRSPRRMARQARREVNPLLTAWHEALDARQLASPEPARHGSLE